VDFSTLRLRSGCSKSAQGPSTALGFETSVKISTTLDLLYGPSTALEIKKPAFFGGGLQFVFKILNTTFTSDDRGNNNHHHNNDCGNLTDDYIDIAIQHK